MKDRWTQLHLTWQYSSTRCCIPSFKVIDLLVPEKEIFKGFYHIWAWRPSWLCDLNHLNQFSFPLPKEDPYEILFQSAQWFQRRRKCWQHTYIPTDDRGLLIFNKLTYEPKGSGELKSRNITVLSEKTDVPTLDQRAQPTFRSRYTNTAKDRWTRSHLSPHHPNHSMVAILIMTCSCL